MQKIIVFITIGLLSGLYWTGRGHEVRPKKQIVSTGTIYFLKPVLFAVVPPTAEITLMPLQGENAEEPLTFNPEGNPRTVLLTARRSMHPT